MGLKYRSSLLLLLTLAVCTQACSVTSWTVVNEEAKDANDYEIVDTRYFLESTNGISPNQPLIHFTLKAVNTYEFAERVLTERYVQQYRPRLGYVLLGAAGAGLSYYAAFSDQLLTRPSDLQRYALTGAGTLLTGLSFLNMKPVGEPKKTGEQRLLRKTGSIFESDTTSANPYSSDNASIRVTYQGEILAESNSWDFEGNRLSINLAENIDASVFEEDPEDNILVEVSYDTLNIAKSVEVASVFEQFVVIDVPLTPLRNEPEANPNNVLNDLAEGSQLKRVSKEGDWYKVLYGISETWVAAGDVRSIWRPSAFASSLSVIAVPNIPFGSIDVEQDIPELNKEGDDYSAFVLSNYEYTGSFTERIYGKRDARLMEEYFLQALGISSNHIIKATNVTSENILDRAYSRLAGFISDSSQTLTVYINGYADIQNLQVYLLGTEHTEDEPQYLNLNKFFSRLGNLKAEKIVVFADLYFMEPNDEPRGLQTLASIITKIKPSSAVIFSSAENQSSGIYSSPGGPQNRHSIFTYYLADALKNHKTSLNEIMEHLDRNISFTSRSLYDRPQTPLLFGERELELID